VSRGDIVAQETITPPRFICAAAPSAPNNRASVCAALTTTTTRTSASSAASAAQPAAEPPAWTSLATAAPLMSYPTRSRPLPAIEIAIPRPIEPKPITPTFIASTPAMAQFLSRAGSSPNPEQGAVNGGPGGIMRKLADDLVTSPLDLK